MAVGETASPPPKRWKALIVFTGTVIGIVGVLALASGGGVSDLQEQELWNSHTYYNVFAGSKGSDSGNDSDYHRWSKKKVRKELANVIKVVEEMGSDGNKRWSELTSDFNAALAKQTKHGDEIDSAAGLADELQKNLKDMKVSNGKTLDALRQSYEGLSSRADGRIQRIHSRIGKVTARHKAHAKTIDDALGKLTGKFRSLSTRLAKLGKEPGPKGRQGKAGDQGPRGPQGSQGIPGEPGPQGPAGAQGPMGKMGKPGPRGKSGVRGLQGPVGPVGAIGKQGKQGMKGEPGHKGPQGVQGTMGKPGKTGPKGAKGAKGAQGPPGIQGPAGLAGKPGKLGAKGKKGIPGNPGAKGAPGAPGRPGLKGSKGKTGDRGLQGPVGTTGPRGKEGAPGKEGPAGPQGQRGAAGPKGEPGPTVPPNSTPPPPPPMATISGYAMNGMTGRKLKSGTVEVVKDGVVVATTSVGSNGKYSLDVPEGTGYTVRVILPGFIEFNDVIDLTSSGATVNANLSPTLPPHEARIIMSWGRTPKDLDSYLQTPHRVDGSDNPEKKFCIINYRMKNARPSRQPCVATAELDVDKTRGYGPETFTITQLEEGVYSYWVQLYSRPATKSRLMASDAKVTLYLFGEQHHFSIQDMSASVSPGSSPKSEWRVFQLHVDSALNVQVTRCVSSDSCTPPVK